MNWRLALPTLTVFSSTLPPGALFFETGGCPQPALVVTSGSAPVVSSTGAESPLVAPLLPPPALTSLVSTEETTSPDVSELVSVEPVGVAGETALELIVAEDELEDVLTATEVVAAGGSLDGELDATPLVGRAALVSLADVTTGDAASFVSLPQLERQSAKLDQTTDKRQDMSAP